MIVREVKIVQPFEACRWDILGDDIKKKFGELGFTQIHCHEIAPIAHNTVYIFSSLYNSKDFEHKSLSSSNFPGFGKTVIDLADSKLWEKFGVKSASLDMADQFEDYSTVLNHDHVCIVYTENTIADKEAHGTHPKGFYDPHNNILVIADITNNFKRKEGRKATRKRVNWLLDRLFEYQNKYAEAVGAAKNEREDLASSFIMGSDVEFEVIERDEVVGADRFYPSLHEDIGRDGHRETGELRPSPNKDPIALAENFKELLTSLHNQMPKGYKICGGSGTKHPLGLHIHFSGVKHDPILIQKLNFMLWDVLKKYQGALRENQGFGRDNDIRKKPHGWEWRPLWSAIRDYGMIESIFCIAHGVVKAHLLGVDLGNSRLKAYKNLPNYDKHRKQIDYFVDCFIRHPFYPIDGEDIRPYWFDYMPERYAVLRYKFLDDDRMEWLYDEIEKIEFNNMLCNWIIICGLIGYGTPDIVTIGVPKEALNHTVSGSKSEFKFGICPDKIPPYELCFNINISVVKRAVVDSAYKSLVVDTVSSIIQETINTYKVLREEGKNPSKTNTFKKVWLSERTSRHSYHSERYDLLDGIVDDLPNLKELSEKDLAILASLYQENPELLGAIRAEMDNRDTMYKLRTRGQYNN